VRDGRIQDGEQLVLLLALVVQDRFGDVNDLENLHDAPLEFGISPLNPQENVMVSLLIDGILDQLESK